MHSGGRPKYEIAKCKLESAKRRGLLPKNETRHQTMWERPPIVDHERSGPNCCAFVRHHELFSNQFSRPSHAGAFGINRGTACFWLCANHTAATHMLGGIEEASSSSSPNANYSRLSSCPFKPGIAWGGVKFAISLFTVSLALSIWRENPKKRHCGRYFSETFPPTAFC